jgi:hypothetical protein
MLSDAAGCASNSMQIPPIRRPATFAPFTLVRAVLNIARTVLGKARRIFRTVMLEKVLKHVANCGRSAWRYSLSGPRRIDLLDQLRLDPDVDICGFPFHAGEVGHFGARRLIIPAKKLIARVKPSESS